MIYDGGLKAIQFKSIGRLEKKVHDLVNSNILILTDVLSKKILTDVQSKIFHDSLLSSNGKSLFGITCLCNKRVCGNGRKQGGVSWILFSIIGRKKKIVCDWDKGHSPNRDVN